MSLNDITGDIEFSIDDLISDLKPEAKEEKAKAQSVEPSETQLLMSRISSLENDNKKLQGLLGNLVEVLGKEDEKPTKSPVEEIELGDEFEPNEFKKAFSALEKGILEKVGALLETKLKPALGVVEGLGQQQKMQQDLVAEGNALVSKYPDVIQYNLGMQDLLRSGINLSTMEEYYVLAKKFGLKNEKYQGKGGEENVKTNVAKFRPSRIESSNVDTTTDKPMKTLKDAILSALEETA